MSVRIHLAGRVTVERGDVALDETRLPSRQGRLVFAMLAAEHLRPVSRDELAEELWGESPPAAWERSLSAVVSRLRNVLEPVGLGGEALGHAFGCYQLHLPPRAWLDLEIAESSLHEAETALHNGDPRAAWAPVQAPLYIGERPFLPGEDGPWATARRAALRVVYLRALEAAAETSAAANEPAVAVRHAERAVSLEPLRESAWRRLMLTYAATGSQAEAVRGYERCRKALGEELGIDPSPETEAVYLSILRDR